MTGEAHESSMPHPVPQIPPMPPMPQIPEMVPMPPLPEGDASVNVAPVVTLPKIEIPEIVIPKINIPAIEVPVEAAAPVFTRPGSTGITQPDKPDISVKKDEDNKFVATREMEFVTKVEPGTPFVVQNKVGKIVVNPSKDKDCTVKAVIRATAETAEKAQELVEQVSMNCHSSKERFYFRPVKSGDDSWNNLNVDLLITVPSGVTPDISTDVGSIEIVDLKERIKCVTNVGSIRAVNVIEDIQLKTKVGDIEFVASNALSAKLQANTKVGSIESEFPLEINKVDMISSKANGTIGSGEKNVNLTTEVGKIRIKKQSSVNIF